MSSTSAKSIINRRREENVKKYKKTIINENNK